MESSSSIIFTGLHDIDDNYQVKQSLINDTFKRNFDGDSDYNILINNWSIQLFLANSLVTNIGNFFDTSPIFIESQKNLNTSMCIRLEDILSNNFIRVEVVTNKDITIIPSNSQVDNGNLYICCENLETNDLLFLNDYIIKNENLNMIAIDVSNNNLMENNLISLFNNNNSNNNSNNNCRWHQKLIYLNISSNQISNLMNLIKYSPTNLQILNISYCEDVLIESSCLLFCPQLKVYII